MKDDRVCPYCGVRTDSLDEAVKKWNQVEAKIAKAREEGRREAIEKAKTLFRNEHDFTGTKAWNLICAIKTLDNALVLLDAKEAGDE